MFCFNEYFRFSFADSVSVDFGVENSGYLVSLITYNCSLGIKGGLGTKSNYRKHEDQGCLP